MELLDVSFVTVLLSVFPWICRLLSVLCVLFVSFPTILLSVMPWNCRPLAVLWVLFFSNNPAVHLSMKLRPLAVLCILFFSNNPAVHLSMKLQALGCVVHSVSFLTILLSVFPWNCRPLAVFSSCCAMGNTPLKIRPSWELSTANTRFLSRTLSTQYFTIFLVSPSLSYKL